MKKIDNFVRCLAVLSEADYIEAENDPIYRAGVIGQFNLTFELGWKAVKAVLQENGVAGAETGSARDILKLAAKTGIIEDQTLWLLMLKDRNHTIHIYEGEEDLDRFLIAIRDSYTPAFQRLEEILEEKQMEIERDEASITHA